MILDYTDFVEQACEEADAVYRSYPSTADVVRAGPRYIEAADTPRDPLAVTKEEELIAMDRWADYGCWRWDTFGEWTRLNKCPYCQADAAYSTEPSHLPGDALRHILVARCLNCGWWEMEEEAKVYQAKDSGHYE